MINKFTKRLLVLVTIITLVLFIPAIALATPTQIEDSYTIILAQATTSSLELNLTPQVRQQLQAVRQRRNKEIKAVLNSSQRAQLARQLRHGNNLNQALEKLNLRPEQESFVKAITQLTNLKIKAILSRHSLTVGNK
jgi:predicted flavoprotein YhiN